MIGKKHLVLCLLALAVCLSLSACGRRPSNVSAPDGADPNAFPRAYPNPHSDPEGTYSK